MDTIYRYLKRIVLIACRTALYWTYAASLLTGPKWSRCHFLYTARNAKLYMWNRIEFTEILDWTEYSNLYMFPRNIPIPRTRSKFGVWFQTEFELEECFWPKTGSDSWDTNPTGHLGRIQRNKKKERMSYQSAPGPGRPSRYGPRRGAASPATPR